MVKRGCSLSGLGAFKQHFLNEIYPEQFALRLHEALWDPRITLVIGYDKGMMLKRDDLRVSYGSFTIQDLPPQRR